MKTRYWILLIGIVCAGCLLLWFFLMLPGSDAAYAEIRSNGILIRTVSLAEDQEFTVTNGEGYNVITVRDGKIAVTEATCPDGICRHRGFCSSGADIVCLPNRLVISFCGDTGVDSDTG